MLHPIQTEKVLRRTDIVDVAKRYTDLRRSGAGWIGRCPFHEEKAGSFYVSPARQTWHCFGACQEGGDAISLVMKAENLDFRTAAKRLAAEAGLAIDEIDEAPEAKQERLHAEALRILNGRVADFYREELHADTPGARAALAYACERWGRDYVEDAGLGYAPDAWDTLARWAKAKGESTELLLELGLLRQKEEKGRVYDFFRARLVIPVRTTRGEVSGFTCRDLSGREDAAKYMNSAESAAYSKSRVLFGLDVAARAAAKAGKIYIVEGAADAMKMHAAGIPNTAAPCGGALTPAQLEEIRRICPAVCFINDADPVPEGKLWGAGIGYVLRHGAAALKAGLEVSVWELPCRDGNRKQDPGEYFTSAERLADQKEEDFILWGAKKLLRPDLSPAAAASAMREVASWAAAVPDDMRVEMLLESLRKIRGGKDLWRGAISAAKRQKGAPAAKGTEEVDLRKYGFFIEKGCYVGQTEKGEGQVWSNFTMRPVFHVKDPENPKRVYSIKNAHGACDIVEIGMEDLCSVTKFRQYIEGLGNYIWLAGDRELTRLKSYLYENTETAVQVRQMGWNTAGFYAFGNGVYCAGAFVKADDFGVCRTEGGRNWYIPAASRLYAADHKKYERERSFIHRADSAPDMGAYLADFVAVHGENGKVGLAYWLASMFRDVVASETRSFPLLNLFGPKGSGKTEMGAGLMAFFRPDNKAPNLRNSTATALNDDVAFASDALVHLDEYKNDIRPDKIEFLKGLYDGVGRVKMGGDGFRDRIMTAVKSGVIVSGQEMPTADPALFSRCVFLKFTRAAFTEEETRRFAALGEVQRAGLSPIVLRVLAERDYFVQHFPKAYALAAEDINAGTDYASLDTRIKENWAKLAAAVRVLQDALPLPFVYADIMALAVEGVKAQCDIIRTGDELAHFWATVAYLQAQGEIFENADYTIETRTQMEGAGIVWPQAKRVIYLNRTRVFSLYQRAAALTGRPALPDDSLVIYLQNAPYYIGTGYRKRFRQIVRGLAVTYTDSAGIVRDKTQMLRTMAFDYDYITARYGLDLGGDAPKPAEPAAPAELPF